MRVLLALCALSLLSIGCVKEEDPRDRPGFVDTSDPSKVGATMTPPPGPSGPGMGAKPASR